MGEMETSEYCAYYRRPLRKRLLDWALESFVLPAYVISPMCPLAVWACAPPILLADRHPLLAALVQLAIPWMFYPLARRKKPYANSHWVDMAASFWRGFPITFPLNGLWALFFCAKHAEASDMLCFAAIIVPASLLWMHPCADEYGRRP